MLFRSEQKTPTSIHLKLEDSGREKLVDQHIQDRKNERIFWMRITTVLLVCFLSYIYIPRFINDSYSQISYLVLDPFYNFVRTGKLYLAPHIFQIKCYLSGEFTWDECLVARNSYPYEFLEMCHLKLTSLECWNLFKTYPLEYTHKCLTTYYPDQQKCFKLLELLTLT